ncbi:hypothetical protein HZS_225 [Henneguya salminicola]|nr:hypothetical protein HZS_225 [Henneguya salminicola]
MYFVKLQVGKPLCAKKNERNGYIIIQCIENRRMLLIFYFRIYCSFENLYWRIWEQEVKRAFQTKIVKAV